MAVDRFWVGACALWLWASVAAGPLVAQEAPKEPGAPPTGESGGPSGGILPKIRFGFEGRLNYRSSDDNRFPVKFPFTPDQLPPGQTQAFEETVNAGSHFEVSKLILYVGADWSESLTAHGRLEDRK